MYRCIDRAEVRISASVLKTYVLRVSSYSKGTYMAQCPAASQQQQKQYIRQEIQTIPDLSYRLYQHTLLLVRLCREQPDPILPSQALSPRLALLILNIIPCEQRLIQVHGKPRRRRRLHEFRIRPIPGIRAQVYPTHDVEHHLATLQDRQR